MSTYLSLLSLIIVITFSAMVIEIQTMNREEGFENQGVYPDSVNNPLLSDSYKVKKNPTISDNSGSDIYKNYPVFPASCTYNNNIRYWKKPTNGTCEPAEFCDTLYEETLHPIPPQPTQPGWDEGIRVNYYESSKFCE